MLFMFSSVLYIFLYSLFAKKSIRLRYIKLRIDTFVMIKKRTFKMN